MKPLNDKCGNMHIVKQKIKYEMSTIQKNAKREKTSEQSSLVTLSLGDSSFSL